MLRSSFLPTKRAWKLQENKDYITLHKSAISEARKIDDTADDLDLSTPGAVRFKDQSDFSGGWVFGLNTDSPHLVLNSKSQNLEPHSSKSDLNVVTTKSRKITTEVALDGEALIVSDNLRQDITTESADHGKKEAYLFADDINRDVILEMNTGETVTDTPDGAKLLLGSGWSIAEFKERKADMS